MSTYNGEKYISEQLNSVLAQNYPDFHITIRDDCSSDNTLQIIKSYIEKYPEKICLLEDEICTGSICKSYSQLLKKCKADYIAFCNQNDVWKKDKLLFEIKKIKQLETVYGKLFPLLVHSDIEIVDDNLNIKQKSFLKYKNLSSQPRLKNLLIENSVIGCTCLFNRPLLYLAKNIPEEVIMHDWWIALLASSFGNIGFVNVSLVLCRNIACNFSLEKNFSLDYLKASIQYSYRQAEILLDNFSKNLPLSNFKIIGDYACFLLQNKRNKIKTIISKGYRKKSIKEFLGQLVFC